MRRNRVIAVFRTSVLASGLPFCASPFAIADSLVLSSTGCPTAHCDNTLSGNPNIQLPSTGGISLVAHDTVSKGSGPGLGCVSNGPGNTVACSLNQTQGTGPNLIVYDGDGNRKWTSSLFNGFAYTSAPIVDIYGDVVATDNATIARFDPNGNVVWKTKVQGLPISMVTVNGNVIVAATYAGPIAFYSFTDGTLLGTLKVTDASGAGYDTINTPCVIGNAIYVSLQKQGDTATGELAKVIVNPGSSPLFSVAWTFPFGGPSGGSPHCNTATKTIYFDGASMNPDGPGPPVLFSVLDTGSAPQMVWAAPLPGKILAAVTQDPRGGVWAFASGFQYLWRFSEADGTIVQTLDVNALIGPIQTAALSAPTSTTNITPAGVMVLGTASIGGLGPSYVAAVNLIPSAGALVWKYKISGTTLGDVANGQFPIVINSSGTARIAFTTHNAGAYFLTPSPCCWNP